MTLLKPGLTLLFMFFILTIETGNSNQFGMLKKFDDSKRFMMDGMTHLACDETANYLVIWCLDLEMEGKAKPSPLNEVFASQRNTS